MHIAELERTPNLVAAQFLPERQRRRLDRMVGRAIHRASRPLQKAMKDARKAALSDLSAYENALCAQATALEDLPW